MIVYSFNLVLHGQVERSKFKKTGHRTRVLEKAMEMRRSCIKRGTVIKARAHKQMLGMEAIGQGAVGTERPAEKGKACTACKKNTGHAHGRMTGAARITSHRICLPLQLSQRSPVKNRLTETAWQSWCRQVKMSLQQLW